MPTIPTFFVRFDCERERERERTSWQRTVRRESERTARERESERETETARVAPAVDDR